MAYTSDVTLYLQLRPQWSYGSRYVNKVTVAKSTTRPLLEVMPGCHLVKLRITVPPDSAFRSEIHVSLGE